MGNVDENSRQLDSKLYKHLELLKTPAEKSKSILINQLKQSKKRFQDELAKVVPQNQKMVLSKKLEKTTNNLKVLKNLSVEDILTYALTTSHKLMKVAANPRIPKETRMIARVCCHKPLSVHLMKVQRKLSSGEVIEESEEDTLHDSSTTLNKIVVNNQIVKMRKCIKRAEIYIMRTLTRNLTKLRSSKATGKLKEKYERKEQRYVKKIKNIKELDTDDVARFALTTTEQRIKELSTDIKAPSKTQAMATLATHKFVCEPTVAFKNLYPDWQKNVPKYLKKKSKKRKIEIKESETQTKRQKIKSESIKANKPVIEKYDGLDDTNSENESSVNEDGVGENDEEDDKRSSDEEENELTDEGEKSDETDEDNDSENQIVNATLRSGDSSSGSESGDNEKLSKDKYLAHLQRKKLVNNLKVPGKKITTVNKNKLTKGIRKTQINDDKTSESSCDETPAAPSLENRPKVVDPFFVTVNDEEYVTSQNPNAYKSNDINMTNTKEHFNTKTQRFNQFDKLSKWGENRNDSWKRNKFSSRESRPFDRNSFNRFEKPTLNRPFPNTVSSFVGNRKERRKALQQSLQPEKVEKLHPSWEAKKKQTTIASFQGKKVVFD